MHVHVAAAALRRMPPPSSLTLDATPVAARNKPLVVMLTACMAVVLYEEQGNVNVNGFGFRCLGKRTGHENGGAARISTFWGVGCYSSLSPFATQSTFNACTHVLQQLVHLTINPFIPPLRPQIGKPNPRTAA